MLYLLLLMTLMNTILCALIYFRFKSFLNEEKSQQASNNEIEKWLQLVEESPNAQKIELLEMALKRFPNSKRIADSLWETYHPLFSNGKDLLIKRQALLKLNESITLFSNHCKIDDLEFLNEKRSIIDDMSNTILNELEIKQREVLTFKINKLKDETDALLKKGVENKLDMDNLAKLDAEIDKDIVKKFPELDRVYQQTSNKIITFFKSLDQNKSKESRQISYNKGALKSAKKAMKKFSDNKSKYKKGEKISDIAKLLGGWDYSKLLPSTSTFVSMVYSEIFKDLKAEARLKISEQMILIPSKE